MTWPRWCSREGNTRVSGCFHNLLHPAEQSNMDYRRRRTIGDELIAVLGHEAPFQSRKVSWKPTGRQEPSVGGRWLKPTASRWSRADEHIEGCPRLFAKEIF